MSETEDGDVDEDIVDIIDVDDDDDDDDPDETLEMEEEEEERGVDGPTGDRSVLLAPENRENEVSHVVGHLVAHVGHSRGPRESRGSLTWVS